MIVAGGLDAGLGRSTHLFLRRIGNGNIHGLSRGILPCGETHVAYPEAINALLQYVSRAQKSLERFLVQNRGARRNGWDALHVYK
jgi:hypothetical protein